MGLRFRKTVSLGKGVRLNFSKGGVSTSLGVPGASINIGNKGTYANVGIPGTGLSYRKKIGGASKSCQPSSRSSAQSSAMQDIASYTGDSRFSFQVDVADNGDVLFFDGDGNEITDKQLISLLKKHPQYKSNRNAIEAESMERSREYAAALQNDTDAFLNIYQLAPELKSARDFQDEYASLRPKQFQIEVFAEQEPTESAVRSKLEVEARKKFENSLPWKRKREIEKYVEDNLENSYAQEMAHWQSMKRSFDSEQQACKAAFEEKAQRRYRKQMRRINAALDGNESYIEWAVGKWLGSCELPVKANAAYEYKKVSKCLLVDLDLPEIDDLPKTYAMQLSSGKYREKEKTQKQIREEYAKCVLGLTVFVAANLFNVSPVISDIVISGYTARRNKAGALIDDYIVSVRFAREVFKRCGYTDKTPEETLCMFENRLNLTSTKIFKSIQPLE